MNKLKIEPVTLCNGEPVVTTTGEPVVITMEQVTEAVEKIEQIPEDAKQAVEGFVENCLDKFNDCVQEVSELSDLDIPDGLIERYPDFLDYLQWLVDILMLMSERF